MGNYTIGTIRPFYCGPEDIDESGGLMTTYASDPPAEDPQPEPEPAKPIEGDQPLPLEPEEEEEQHLPESHRRTQERR